MDERIRGSDSDQMLLRFDSTACDDDLVPGPPFAYFLSWPVSISPAAMEGRGSNLTSSRPQGDLWRISVWG